MFQKETGNYFIVGMPKVGADGLGTTLLPRVCWLLPPHVGDGLGSIYSGPRTWYLVPGHCCCCCSCLLLQLLLLLLPLCDV